ARPVGLSSSRRWVHRRACPDRASAAPEHLGPVVNTAASATRPGQSNDGPLLFFTSTRAGGQGLSDLYVSQRANAKDDFAWGPPVGLGPDVNTAASEAGAEYSQPEADGTGNR